MCVCMLMQMSKSSASRGISPICLSVWPIARFIIRYLMLLNQSVEGVGEVQPHKNYKN